MQRIILIGITACVGASVLVGCGSPESSQSTPKDKDAFKGGAMPADAQKSFQQTQKDNADKMQKMIQTQRDKAAAGH